MERYWEVYREIVRYRYGKIYADIRRDSEIQGWRDIERYRERYKYWRDIGR